MTQRIQKASLGAAALAACALVGATVALGAGSKPKATHTTTTGTSTTARPAHVPEAPLTGTVLASVKAAAIAKVGGTVDFASEENDSTNAAAKYEAHVTKADGTHVTVILDGSFAVLSVETGGPGGHGGPFGPGGRGPGNGETELTGDVATKAKAAAVAKAGGTADRASTENDSTNAAAKYEVHVTKADGSHVVVILDASYGVISVETAPDHGPGPGGFHPRH